jgi:5-aminopentanamidase
MKIALFQAGGTPADVAANLASVARAAADAADAGASLVVFPEAFLTGYNIGERSRELAEPLDGPSPTALRRIAREAGIAVVCGYCERAGEEVHNAAVLVDRDGEVLVNYRKTHLFGDVDRAAFTPGDEFAVAEVDGERVGVLICYDIEFPEPARGLALAGAELIVVPTSLMAPFDWVSRTVVPARAAENQLFVAYANRVGREGDLSYVGQSCVAGPDGSEIARAGRDEEVLLLAELDRAAVAGSRAAYCYLEERRPDLYGALAELPTPRER